MPRQANRFGGGANTNRNGLHFEQTTSLNTALKMPDLSLPIILKYMIETSY